MIIDGKKIAQEIQDEIKAALLNNRARKPCLAVVLVGEHPASQIYVNRKAQACEDVGIRSLKLELPPTTSESALLKQIEQLNNDPDVDGILVQLPLPHQINPTHITEAIKPEKDVDGFHPTNVGKMLIGETDGFLPCTPLGIRMLLERSKIEVAGKHALILGRSNIVGKPMAAILMQSNPEGNATVTIAHSRTRDLAALTKQADIIIAAIGQPLFLKADMIKEGAVVIDVGINKIEDASRSTGYRIVGDADFANIKDKCSFITPVPGGVGPMTIAMLLSNTLKSYYRRTKHVVPSQSAHPL
jgi:methylenetetrahydrofolate dehydrogenase (NADP+) / methenyltetrahydrofolate cyclohydrolase